MAARKGVALCMLGEEHAWIAQAEPGSSTDKVRLVNPLHAPVDEALAAMKEAKSVGAKPVRRGVYLVIPRRSAFVRTVKSVPTGRATADELRRMAYFQLQKDSPIPADKLYFRVLAANRNEGKADLDILAVPAEIIEKRISAISGQAGVRVLGVFVDSDLAGFLLPKSVHDECAAVMYPCDDSRTLAVLNVTSDQVQYSAAFTDREGESLGSQIDRTLASWDTASARAPSRILSVHPEDSESPPTASIPLEPLNLAELIEGQTPAPSFAPLIAAAKGVLFGDKAFIKGRLLQPKPSAAAPRRIPLEAPIAAGLALLVAITLLVLHLKTESAIAAEQESRKELQALAPRIKAVQEITSAIDSAAAWGKGRHDWISVLESMAATVDPAELIISEAALDKAGSATIRGKSRRNDSVAALAASMNRSGRFQNISIASMSEAADPAGFTVQFVLRGRALTELER